MRCNRQVACSELREANMGTAELNKGGGDNCGGVSSSGYEELQNMCSLGVAGQLMAGPEPRDPGLR